MRKKKKKGKQATHTTLTWAYQHSRFDNLIEALDNIADIKGGPFFQANPTLGPILHLIHIDFDVSKGGEDTYIL